MCLPFDFEHGRPTTRWFIQLFEFVSPMTATSIDGNISLQIFQLIFRNHAFLSASALAEIYEILYPNDSKTSKENIAELDADE